MKKIFLALFLLCTGLSTHAQNGLENIIVEKYYVSNAADAAGSVGNLPVGSITYRIWVDMLPNYKFQAVYGVPGHEFRIATSTAFFNNEDYGATTPSVSATNVRKNSVLLDSYFSVGAAASGKVAVFKSEDSDGSPGNTDNILQNNDPAATGAINIGTTTNLSAQDGMIAGAPQSVTFVGLSVADLDVFDGLSNVGSLFSTSNGSVASLTGSSGATTANRVLIAQVTTNGVLSFKLNIQIGTPNGGVQNYVAENPVGNEIQLSSLSYPLVASVGITANPQGPICSKTSVTFTANPVNGGSTPVYQWKRNGVNVGTNSPVYTNASLKNNDQVICVMTSNLPDVIGNPAMSNTYNMQVFSLPSATIDTSGPTVFCAGTTPLTLTANSGNNFSYQWRKGTTDITGATGISYVPIATGTYRVIVTNANGCTKSSSPVVITVNSLPTASITPQGPLTFCAGGSVVLQANPGTGLSYQWKKGANLINGATFQNFTANSTGTYRVIVTNVSSGCSKTSPSKTVSVNCKSAMNITESLNQNIYLFPNPAVGPFTITYSNALMEDTIVYIEIVNMIGENIFSGTADFRDGELSTDIDLSTKAPNGIYLVKLELNNKIFTGRIMIQ